MSVVTYRTTPIRVRRTKEDMGYIRLAIYEALYEDNPMTVRQVFYRLVSTGVIEKAEGEYKQTVCRLLTEMRLDGVIPFGWIADNTRWMRKPRTFTSLDHALKVTAETYRRALWHDLPTYCEIWLEKDALAGVLYEETEQWDVPLMVTRGYASLSYLHEAAEAIAEQGKPAYIYYLGDYDPSGMDIPRKVEARLREFAPDAEIHFERVAVTPEQIVAFALPTRPTKTTDSRSKGFAAQSVEVDAMASATLRALVRTCITRHVEEATLAAVERVEDAEREVLAGITAAWTGGGK
ncbi:MAG: hypothetical protein ACR2JW_17525 [Thermomicrobiales bacterium]